MPRMRVGADGVAAAAATKSVVAWLWRVGPVSAWVLFSCAVQRQHSCACQACPLARLTAAGTLGCCSMKAILAVVHCSQLSAGPSLPGGHAALLHDAMLSCCIMQCCAAACCNAHGACAAVLSYSLRA